MIIQIIRSIVNSNFHFSELAYQISVILKNQKNHRVEGRD